MLALTEQGQGPIETDKRIAVPDGPDCCFYRRVLRFPLTLHRAFLLKFGKLRLHFNFSVFSRAAHMRHILLSPK